MELVAIKGHRPERPDRDEAPQMTDDVWCLAERCWTPTAFSRPSIDDICDIITPFVKISDNHASNIHERLERDDAPQMTNDVLRLVERSEDTPPARPSINNIRSSIIPFVKLDFDDPANTVPQDGDTSTHIPNPSSAYDRLLAGATFRQSFVINGQCDYVSAIAMTHDCRTVASSPRFVGCTFPIAIWDVTSGARTTSLQGHTADISSLAFFNNGSLVSCS
jgi:hypothetical protein